MREKRMSKATHRCTELGQIRGAKHMTGCNKGERNRERKQQSVRIWNSSVQTGEQHTALQREPGQSV